MANVEIVELKRMDLRNAVIIDGFPSIGLVSSIVANYLIALLKLEYIAVMDSDAFPTLSLIRNGEPLGPAGLCKVGDRSLVSSRWSYSRLSSSRPRTFSETSERR
jgi:predicted ATP-grasp superfamily ATP-dependent carboligase